MCFVAFAYGLRPLTLNGCQGQTPDDYIEGIVTLSSWLLDRFSLTNAVTCEFAGTAAVMVEAGQGNSKEGKWHNSEWLAWGLWAVRF